MGRGSTARLTKPVALARRLGDGALLGVALTWLGGLKYLDSQPEGRRELAEALALEQRLGPLPTSVYESPQMWQAAALLWSDDPDGASATAPSALQPPPSVATT